MKTMALALASLIALSSTVAFADEHPNVQKARDQMRAVRYDAAVPLLETALASGGNDRNALIAIHKMMGEMLAPMGESEKAKDHFKQMLVLSPGANLGSMVSPKIVEILDEAKRELGSQKLEVTQTINSASHSVELQVVSDPTNQVVGARARFKNASGSTSRVDVEGTESLRIELPAGSESVNVFIIDQYGNQLQTFALGNVSFGNQVNSGGDFSGNANNSGSRSGDFSGQSSERPFIKKWWPWAGVAGVAGLTGLYFSSKLASTESDIDDLLRDDPMNQTRLNELNDQGKRYQTLQYPAYGIAGVAAAASIYFLISQSGDDSDGRQSLVAPMIDRNGGGIIVRMPF